MDITIPTSDHRAAIAAAADALRKTPGLLPALSLVRIEAHADGRITFEGTDLDFGVRAETHGTVRVPGVLCLSGAQLAELATESDPDGETIIRTDGPAAIIEAGRSQCRLATTSAEEYLGNPDPTGGNTVPVGSESLRRMAADVAWLVSKEESHGALCGVLLETTSSGVRLVASNSRQLALSETDAPGSTAGCSRIVPPQFLSKAERLLKGRGPVTLTVAKSAVGLHTTGLTLTARVLAGDYPAYASVLPRTPTTTIVAPTAKLLQTVRMMTAVAREHEFKAIFARAENGCIRMWSRAPTGTVKDSVDAVVDGEPVLVAFNALMMADVLKSVRSPDVRIRFHGPTGGILVDGRSATPEPIRALWLVSPVAQEMLDCSEPPDPVRAAVEPAISPEALMPPRPTPAGLAAAA